MFHGWDSTIFVGIETSQLNNSLEFGSFTSIDSEIGMLPVFARYAARRRDAWGGSQAAVGVRQNITGIVSNSDAVDYAAFREDSQEDFTVFQFSLDRYQKLFGGFTLAVNTKAQYSNDRLIPSEQFRLGGSSTVRGYEQSEVTADQGFLIRTEIRSPSLPRFITWIEPYREAAENLQLVGFYDYGKAYVVDPLPGDVDSEDIAGAGFGLRYQLSKFFLGTVDIGWPLDNTSNTKAGNPTVHFAIVLNF